MPDSPDYSKYRLESARVSLADMGELAVRLGSPVAYDRLGTVVFMDKMQNGFSPYDIDAADLVNEVFWSVDTSEYGPYSMKLYTVAGSSAGPSIRRRVNPININKFGFEIGLNMVSQFEFYGLEITQVHNSKTYSYVIRIYGNDQKISYLDTNLNYIKFADTGVLYTGIGLFHNIKMIVDEENHTYHKFMIDANSYDLSGIPTREANSVLGDETKMRLFMWQTASTVTTAYLGHWIATIDEI